MTTTETKRVVLNRGRGPGFYTAINGRFEIWPMDSPYGMPARYGVKDRQTDEFGSEYGLDRVRERIAVRIDGAN